MLDIQQITLDDFIDISEDTYYLEDALPLLISQPSATYFPGKAINEDRTLVKYNGKHLPHWQASAVIYHVSFRLCDSVPEAQQKEWLAERSRLSEIALKEKRPLTQTEAKHLQYLYSDKIEQFLDQGYGSCLLRDIRVAEIVKKSFEYNDNKRYQLHAWCIMPNHVHVIFNLLSDFQLSDLLHGWKSFTAHAINKLLGRNGNFWQKDCYNHIIRTEAEYNNQIQYVWNNPTKAGFLDWNWRWKCNW